MKSIIVVLSLFSGNVFALDWNCKARQAEFDACQKGFADAAANASGTAEYFRQRRDMGIDADIQICKIELPKLREIKTERDQKVGEVTGRLSEIKRSYDFLERLRVQMDAQMPNLHTIGIGLHTSIQELILAIQSYLQGQELSLEELITILMEERENATSSEVSEIDGKIALISELKILRGTLGDAVLMDEKLTVAVAENGEIAFSPIVRALISSARKSLSRTQQSIEAFEGLSGNFSEMLSSIEVETLRLQDRSIKLEEEKAPLEAAAKESEKTYLEKESFCGGLDAEKLIVQGLIDQYANFAFAMTNAQNVGGHCYQVYCKKIYPSGLEFRR